MSLQTLVRGAPSCFMEQPPYPNMAVALRSVSLAYPAGRLHLGLDSSVLFWKVPRVFTLLLDFGFLHSSLTLPCSRRVIYTYCFFLEGNNAP